MLFPESPRVLYGENPLTEVICQLRFPTILEISAADPAAFQSLVRGRYPLYEKTEGPTIELPAEVPDEFATFIGQVVGSRAHKGPTYKFLAADSRRTITLTREFVALSDTAYADWERYREDLELVHRALRDVYSPAFFTRIGLRYKNLIDKAQLGLADEAWDALLNEALIGGLLSSADLREHVESTQTIAVVNFTDVAGGFVRLRHGLAGTFPEGQAQPYVLDADFYTTEGEATQDAVATLDTFNRISGRLFRWAIRQKLHDALRPVEAG